MLFHSSNNRAAEIALKPALLDSVSKREDAYCLATDTFVVDEADRVFVEAEAPGSFSDNRNYRKDDAAAMGAAVENLIGSYIVRPVRAGTYEMWCRVKAPWHGTWSFSLKMQNTSAADAAPAVDVPEGWETKSSFAEQSMDQIAVSSALIVAAADIKRYIYVKGCTLTLAAEAYNLELQGTRTDPRGPDNLGQSTGCRPGCFIYTGRWSANPRQANSCIGWKRHLPADCANGSGTVSALANHGHHTWRQDKLALA